MQRSYPESIMSYKRPISQSPNIETVLITGGNGYIAAHIIEQLLTTTDYKIRASVRNLLDPLKTNHLRMLPHASKRLSLFQADILDEGAYDDEMTGCDVLFHAAAPYCLTSNNPERDFMEPAEKGTLNLLTSAVKSKSIHTVVLTSSMRAIAERPMNKVLDEGDWNEESTLKWNPYFYAKTRAEKVAWEFWEKYKRLQGIQAPFRMVTINPAMVIGPAHTKTLSQSPRIIFELMNGKITAILGLSFWLVDVRDVAKAHILAARSCAVSGRYVCAAETLTMEEIVRILKIHFPRYKYPLSIKLPTVVAKLVSLKEPLGRSTFVRSNVGRGIYEFDNSKIKNLLGLEFRNVEETLWDQAADFLKWGHLPDRPINTWGYKMVPPVTEADAAERRGWAFSNYVNEDQANQIQRWIFGDHVTGKEILPQSQDPKDNNSDGETANSSWQERH